MSTAAGRWSKNLASSECSVVQRSMITVHVRYHNILRQRTGLAGEELVLPSGTNLGDAIRHLADRHGPGLAAMLLAQGGEISSYLVVFLNGQLVVTDRQSIPLSSGDELKLFPSISGG
jgi:molybdopterin converting factor small subunit